MAGRVQQDAFIDDSDESCPLCVEEFDLSDKNFRPCPCGYQVCQFCYNNIKNHMNGLCPACRRPYDDQSIEWKIVSPEEQKADIALQARKKALARKKESEQRQVETLNRKNLAGIRVVQKNLVYVVGLSQKSSEEEFLRTLRGPQYFGQYGKITKIVVSKAKEGQNNTNNNSIGVYVTFESREDAAKCIAAVDGSPNAERTLRAQYGTTKYCSAFLRNETCGNRNCTFLHETGEDNDSFSRADLSSMNALSTQRPAQQSSSSRSSQQPPQPQPQPQQASHSISAVSQAVVRDEAMSRSDSGDGSALPSSASWAAKNAQNESTKSSKAASVAASSPATTNPAVPVQPAETRQVPSEPPPPDPSPSVQPRPHAYRQAPPPPPHPLERSMKIFRTSDYTFRFNRKLYSEEQLRAIDTFPPLIDDYGGLIRYRIAKEREQERQKQEEERNVIGAMSAAEDDEAPASGSLQLGGEPETQDDANNASGRMSAQQRSAIQPPFGPSSNMPFGGSNFLANNAANLTRTLTPQQQHQLSLLRSHSRNQQSPVNNSHFQAGYTGNTSLHHHQQSNPFQMQNQAFNTAQGHSRQASRYTFANDSASASTAVKPVANPQMMAQQAAMMPGNQNKHFQSQQLQSNIPGNQFYSGVQGPPPGLKSSGTPPISGGGMFGQGHGFASAMGGSAGFGGGFGGKSTNDDLMRELLRTRNGSVNGQGSDIGKHSFSFPSRQESIQPINRPLNKTSLTQPEVTASSSKPEVPVTPTQPPINPGSSLPQDFPPLAAPQHPPPAPPRPPRKVTAGAAIKPAVPAISASSSKATSTQKDLQQNEHATSTTEPATHTMSESSMKPKPKQSGASSSVAETRTASKTGDPLVSHSSKAVEKKPRPSKLDIMAVNNASKKEQDSADTTGLTSGLLPSHPPTPATTVSQTSGPSATRPNQARATRAPPPPKAETLPASPATAPAITSKQTSRRPSVTSIERPGTPVSEKTWDDMSLASATFSRANSPPPTKVGSAPVRQTTKSQQKKERQARAKQAEEASKVEELPAKVVEPMQAPIVGRKKKAKKERTQGTADSTPTPTRPTSPVPKEEEPAEGKTEPVTPVKENRKVASKIAADTKEPDTPSSPPTPASHDQQKPSLSAASIFASLIKSGELSPTVSELFKTFTGLNHRLEAVDPDPTFADDATVSDRQMHALDQGEAIIIEKSPTNHVVVLPDRSALHGLTAAQAARYLELRTQALANGDVPSNQAFTSLAHVLPQINLPIARISSSRTSSEDRKLPNHFAAPTAPPGSSSLSTHMQKFIGGTGDGGRGGDEDSATKRIAAAAAAASTLSVADAEQELASARKETEMLEKKLNALMKRNRRLLFGSAH